MATVTQLVRSALGVLEGCGVRVAEQIRAHAITSAGSSNEPIRHQADPLTSVVLWLAEQDRPAFLRANPWFLPYVELVLARIASQMQWTETVDRENHMEEISLCARRLLVIRSGDVEEVPLQEHFNFFKEECCLPDVDSPLGTLQTTKVGSLYVDSHFTQILRFSAGEPLRGRGSRSVSSLDELAEIKRDADAEVCYHEANGSLEVVQSGRYRPKNRFRFAAETAVTQSLARTASLEAFSYQVLRNLGKAAIPELQLSEFLKFHLGLFHGIPHLDVADLGLRGFTNLGRITRTHLHLAVGSPYYGKRASCYAKSVLSLPLADEIASKLKTLPDAFFEHETLEHAFDEHHSRSYNAWLKKTAEVLGFQGSVWGQALHLVFTRVCIHDLHFCPSISGLICARALPLSWGQSNYVCATSGELREISRNVPRRIREKAGIAPPPAMEIQIKEVEDDNQLHGTPCPSFVKVVEGLRHCIESARTHNEIVACAEGFTRILGRRNVGDPVNPLAYYSSYPKPCLAFADKIIEGESRRRSLPITAPIANFLETCGTLFGRNEILPFLHGNEFKPLSGIPDAVRYRQTFSVPGMKQASRTSFFNMLRQEGANDLLLDSLMGHGPDMFQPMGHMNPFSLESLHDILSDFLFPLYDKYGVDDLATLLTCRMKELVSSDAAKVREPLRASEEAPVRRVGDESEKEPNKLALDLPIAAEEYRPWANDHHGRKVKPDNRVADPGSLPKCIAHFPLSPYGLAIALATLGVPPENLIRFSAYYSTENFILDRTTGQTYFLALGDHPKLGGLTVYPLPLCGANDLTNNPVVCLLLHLFGKTTAPRRLFPKHFEIGNSNGSKKSVKAMIGASFRPMIPVLRNRTQLTETEAYKLLRRTAHQTCRAKYPAPVLFALVAGKKCGLNNMAVEDVLRLRDGRSPDLVYFLSQDKPYSSASRPRSGKIPDEKLAAVRREVSLETKLPMVFEAIKAHGVIPSSKTLKPVLKRCGCTEKQQEIALRALMVLARKKGLLCVAKAEPLLSTIEQDQLVNKIAKERDPDTAIESILQLCSGCRTGEFRNQRSRNANDEIRHKVILDPVYSASFVVNGKSVNAKRWINLQEVGTARQIDALFSLVPELRKDHQRGGRVFSTPESPKLAAKEMNEFLRKFGSDLSTHQLRRSYFLRNYESLMKDPIRGPFFSRLCSIAVMGGHGSIGTSIREYLGTGILAFGSSASSYSRSRPGSISEEQAGTLFRMAFDVAYGNRTEAEKALRSKLSGDDAYFSVVRTQMRRELRTIESGTDECPTVTLELPEAKLVAGSRWAWRCELQPPRGGISTEGAPSLRLRAWEAAALRIVERCLRLRRSVAFRDHSGRRAFRNKLLLLIGRYEAKVVLLDN